MDEIREFTKGIESMDIAQMQEALPTILEKIKEVGFLKLVKDSEAKELMPSIREKIKIMEPSDLETMMPLVLPVILDGMTELINASENAKDELEDMDDMTIHLVVPDFVTIAISVHEGVFKADTSSEAEPDLKIDMEKEVWFKLMKGEADPVSSYMAGDLHMTGEIQKAMQLRGLFEILSDEYDFDMSGFTGM